MRIVPPNVGTDMKLSQIRCSQNRVVKEQLGCEGTVVLWAEKRYK